MLMNKKNEIPELFFERLVKMTGFSVATEIKKTFVERPTTFRVNTIKGNRTQVLESLRSVGFKVDIVSWLPEAFILRNKTKRNLTETDLYKEGKIYIQSLASMVSPLVLDPQSGEKILDLTAAPGSKTSQIAAMMKCQGELMANDNNKIRFFKLKHNMELLGVSQADWKFTLRMEHGAQLAGEFPAYFDKILLDAPCSAEARFVDDEPKTYGYWSEHKIKEMAFKQRTLLLSAWNALKPGGILVYSTCTFAPEENELQIARLLERMPDAKLLPVELPGLKKISPLVKWKEKLLPKELTQCYRILPTKEIEGFFIAKIIKQKDPERDQFADK